MAIGYSSPDWGMDGWNAREERDQAEQEAQADNADDYLAECIAVAKREAIGFYRTGIEQDTLAEDADTWPDFLMEAFRYTDDKSITKEIKEAAEYWLEDDADFFRYRFVEQAAKEAGIYRVQQ